MFWGLTLDSIGKRYSQTVDQSFHVSMAALEVPDLSSKEPVSLFLEREKSHFLLCTLDARRIHQQTLDLMFAEGEEVIFYLKGGEGTKVHLSGYLMEGEPDLFDRSSELSDESLSDSEAPELVSTEEKKKIPDKKGSLAVEVKGATKRKLLDALTTEKIKKLRAQESDDDDDDDDDDEDEDEDDFFDSEAEEAESGEEEDEEEDEEEEYSSDEELFKKSFLNKKADYSAKKQQTTPTSGKDSKTGQKPKLSTAQTPKTPGGQAPKTPGGQAPKTPGGQASKTPGGQAPKTPGGQAPKTPGGQTPKTPNIKTPADPNSSIVNSSQNGTPESGKKKKKKKKRKNKEGQTPGGVSSTPNVQQQSQKQTPKPQQTPQQKTPKPQQGGYKATPGKKQVLAGGTTVDDVKVGHGPEARPGKTVHVYYIGKLAGSGKQFDSRTEGKPFRFKLGKNEVIKGWETGLQGMRVGGKRLISVPPSQGYGQKQEGPIPANSTLIFEVELKAVS